MLTPKSRHANKQYGYNQIKSLPYYFSYFTLSICDYQIILNEKTLKAIRRNIHLLPHSFQNNIVQLPGAALYRFSLASYYVLSMLWPGKNFIFAGYLKVFRFETVLAANPHIGTFEADNYGIVLYFNAFIIRTFAIHAFHSIRFS